MENNHHILIVDDNAEIRKSLAKYLQKMGLRVSVSANGREMRQKIQDSAIDLILLDIMLPDESGLILCQSLKDSNIPIIMITAVADEADRIVGLELGADDYVCKPFNPRELLARIKAVLRRSEKTNLKPKYSDVKRFKIDEWIFDLSRREIEDKNGVSYMLSNGEFNLLEVLANRPGQIMTREMLLDLCSGKFANPFDRSIDNIVSRLRKKLEYKQKSSNIIKTVWGTGYVLAAEVTDITSLNHSKTSAET